MGFKDILRRALRPTPTPDSTSSTGRNPSLSPDFERAWATRWLEALESGRLSPPRDVHDAAGWDTYWTNQLEVGPADLALSDLMSSDAKLIDLFTIRAVRMVLCVGNGLSTEALSLAMHGFHVTALDISAVASGTLSGALQHPEHHAACIPGFSLRNGSFVFGDSGPIPAELCPKIHQTASHRPQAGGTLTFVTGDLVAPDICPGPFDVVIERRTVQLFPEEERSHALTRLVSRLAERGVFVSHHHDGRAGPGSARHYAREWVKSNGFVLDYEVDAETCRSAARLACLRLSTG